MGDEDPDRPRDLTKEEMKLLQFYCRNKRRLIDVQKFFADAHMFKRERNDLTQILADLAAKTDKCKMRHCEVGTLLNKLIHGETQGREDVGEGGELSQIDQAIKEINKSREASAEGVADATKTT